MNKSVVNSIKTALMVGMVCLGACKDAKPKFSERDENRAERAESIKKAFVEGGDFTDKTEQKKIAERVINQFGKALLDKNKAGLEKTFSVDSFINYCFQVSTKNISAKTKKQLKAWMASKFTDLLIQQSEGWAFHETEIMSVDVISDKEMAVFTKQWDNAMEVYTRTRWWLVEEEGQWKIYDLEDLDSMFKFSSMMVSGIEASSKDTKWLEAFKRISAGVNEAEDLASIDFTEMESDADFILQSNAPDDFKKIALIFYLRALLDTERYDEMLKEANDALKKFDQSFVLYQLMGHAYAGKEEYDKAIANHQKYTEALGEDSQTMMLLSDVYFAKGDLVKAREYCLAGIKMNPRDSGNVASYAVVLEDSEWSEILPLIEQTGKAKDAMELTLDYAIQNEKLDFARWLFVHFKKQFPDETDLIDYYDGELAEQEEPAEPAEPADPEEEIE